MSNNYYWRAVRRIAKRKGISVTKARRLDWEKEANAERKRRSKAARSLYKTSKPRSKPITARTTKVPRVPPDRTRKIPGRIPKVSKPKTIPTRVPGTKLKIKDYGRMRAQDEEEYEEGQGFEEQWAADWEDDYPDLDYLDDLEQWVEDFEYEDSDKYKEPS